MNILLVCAAGMSTSLLVASMRKFADEGTKIEAVAFSQLDSVVKEYDVILVGPQLRYKLKDIQKIGDANNIPVDVIDALSYGRMDGQRTVEFAKKLYSENK
ncbi:PTS sugar transporter subunit IIB [Clostridium intestinale]|jgi:PTS system cellobiose-specific IIB component|uniref:PTS sugar transporter subunit IIB n=1 Tax=Clostridium intestinale TaxID=36845 RepID=UPI0028E5CDA8|nr:PTS sugar transporter subunit IIB [Clostridium intestinale]